MSNGSFAPSFASDEVIVIAGWPLSKTSRDCSPYFSVCQIQHRNDVGIYGPDGVLSHEDWQPSGAGSSPDAAGNVHIPQANDSLTLVPVSNYKDRLENKVPAQTAPEGIPNAYIRRKASVYKAPWPDYPEDPESIYSLLGWAYLYVTLDAPEVTTVTLRVTFRGYLSHNDSHVSDSTRQTDFVPEFGPEYTLEYTASVGPGAGRLVCFDLLHEQPMTLVTRYELEFGVAGAWKITEPLLREDDGDVQVRPPREAVSPHWGMKFFDHWRYAVGGGSAIEDGQFEGALTFPHGSHLNTLERTAGHFSYVVGAVSGIDLTSAWSLQGWLSLVGDTSEAWETTFDTAAHEAACKDDEDNWLKVLHVFDQEPFVKERRTAPNVAIRVGQWTTAAGLHYDFTAVKRVRSAAHGSLQTPGGHRLRNALAASRLWRRQLGASDVWQEVESLDSDGHGHWHSGALDVVAEYDGDDAVLWQYGIGQSADSVILPNRGAVREYIAATIAGAIIDLIQWQGADGLTHVYAIAGPIIHWWIDAWGDFNHETVIRGRDYTCVRGWADHGKASPAHVLFLEAEEDGDEPSYAIYHFVNRTAGHMYEWEEVGMAWDGAELIGAVDCPQRGEYIVLGRQETEEEGNGGHVVNMKRGLKSQGEGVTWLDAEGMALVDTEGNPLALDLYPGDMEQQRAGTLVLIAVRRDTGALVRIVSADAGLSWVLQDESA